MHLANHVGEEVLLRVAARAEEPCELDESRLHRQDRAVAEDPGLLQDPPRTVDVHVDTSGHRLGSHDDRHLRGQALQGVEDGTVLLVHLLGDGEMTEAGTGEDEAVETIERRELPRTHLRVRVHQPNPEILFQQRDLIRHLVLTGCEIRLQRDRPVRV